MKRLRLSIVATLFMLVGLAGLAGPATPPAFRAIAADEVADANLDQMIASAKTPADHEVIAAYYDKEAADAETKAKLHHSTAKTCEKFRLKPTDMAHHCDEPAKHFQRAADQAKALTGARRCPRQCPGLPVPTVRWVSFCRRVTTGAYAAAEN